jgi:vacuolar-type H+-ATPase subunit F/Vma7
MAEAVTSVTLLGGGFDDIVKSQKDISQTLGTNLILNSQSYEKLFATTKVTDQSATLLTKNFKDAGYSVYAIGDQMQKVMDVSRSIGVNGVQVSKQVVDNMASMNQYNFQGGVEGMAKMAAQAVNLRIDMKDTLAIANRLFDPEKAIDMAAAMQRLGVAQGDLLDPLKLMDLGQNDPAELQNQIAEMSKSFTRLKADGTGFEILPGEKRRMMEISQELFGNTQQLGKMALAAGDLDLKMSKIKFSDAITDESTQKLIANMAEMGEGGEYKVTYTDAKGNVQTKNVTEIAPEDIEAITKASQPKSMEDLAKEQLTTQQKMAADVNSIAHRTGLGLAGTKSVTMAENAGREMSGAVSKFASGKSISVKGVRENVGGGLDDFIKTLNEGKPMEAFVTAASGTANYMNTVYNEALVKGKEGFDDLSKSSNPLIQIMDKIVAKGANFIVDHEKLNESNKMDTTKVTEVKPVKDFVKFPGETVEPLEVDTIFGMTRGKELLNPSTPNNSTPESTTSNIKMEDVNINLNIKIDAPSNMDTAQLMLAFNDQSVKGALINAFQNALGNANGSNGSNPNPIESRKQMAKMANV